MARIRFARKKNFSQVTVKKDYYVWISCPCSGNLQQWDKRQKLMIKSHSANGKPCADSMLQVVWQFYTTTRPCVLYGLVWYEYMIVCRWSYSFNIHIYIDKRDWVINKFTKDFIRNLSAVFKRDTFINDVKFCNNRSKLLCSIQCCSKSTVIGVITCIIKSWDLM